MAALNRMVSLQSMNRGRIAEGGGLCALEPALRPLYIVFSRGVVEVVGHGCGEKVRTRGESSFHERTKNGRSARTRKQIRRKR